MQRRWLEGRRTFNWAINQGKEKRGSAHRCQNKGESPAATGEKATSSLFGTPPSPRHGAPSPPALLAPASPYLPAPPWQAEQALSHFQLSTRFGEGGGRKLDPACQSA